MTTRFCRQLLLYVLVLVIGACGLEPDQDAKTQNTCPLPCEADIYTEDLLTIHPWATIDALRDYLLQKKNLKKSSPFRTVSDGKGDMHDLLRGITIAKNAYGINPLFALSLSALESQWGQSSIARTKYNLWGWNANDGRTHEASKFESFSHGFNHVFRSIRAWYLNPDGRHHKSCQPPEHFKRYVRRGGCSVKHCGASLAGMNCKYASDPKWALKIRSQMNHIARFVSSRCDRLISDFTAARLELPRFPTQPGTNMLSFTGNRSYCG